MTHRLARACHAMHGLMAVFSEQLVRFQMVLNARTSPEH